MICSSPTMPVMDLYLTLLLMGTIISVLVGLVLAEKLLIHLGVIGP